MNWSIKVLNVIVFILISLVIINTYRFKNAKAELQVIYSSYIGEKYTIDGKTLTIVGYSTINQTFLLSNGISVNYRLMEK